MAPRVRLGARRIEFLVCFLQQASHASLVSLCVVSRLAVLERVLGPVKPFQNPEGILLPPVLSGWEGSVLRHPLEAALCPESTGRSTRPECPRGVVLRETQEYLTSVGYHVNC